MTQAIFLSYASQDADAARRICDDLRAAGLEVWFDQSELRGGDAWDQSIRKQIKECALFVPVISGNTDAREEGYFRLEWKLAVDRSHLMADDKAFFFPVILGDVAEPTARVPDKFRERQWTRLGSDAAFGEFAGHLAKVVEGRGVSGNSAPKGAPDGAVGNRSGITPAAPAGIGQSAGAQELPASRAQPNLDPGSLAKTGHHDNDEKGKRDALALSSARGANSSNPSRKLLIIAAAPVLAAATFFGIRHFTHTQSSEITSIAVLPFALNSADADADYLSEGLAETLIYQLSQAPKFKVTPASSVRRYKGKDLDPLKVGKELDVGAVMAGRLTQRGESLSISVELVDVRNNKALWGEKYERRMADLLATQRDIASEIARKLQLRLSGEAERAITKRYTNNNEAYQAYLKGRYLYVKRGPENLRRSIEHYREAIRLDARFALAQVGLADSYTFLSFFDDSATFIALATDAANQALKIDPDLAEAHSALASLHAMNWNWADAEGSFKRALALNDSVANIHYFYAMNYLFPNGRIQEGTFHVERAVALEPMTIVYAGNLARAFMYAGQYEQALTQIRKVYALEPSHPSAQGNFLHILTVAGRPEEAIRVGESIPPEVRSRTWNAFMAHAYALAGRSAEARKILPDLLGRDRATASLTLAALVQSALGDRDSAFASLEVAFKSREFELVNLKVDTRFAPLRDDPRFASLIKRMGLQHP